MILVLWESNMKGKTDVRHGTLSLIVLKTLYDSNREARFYGIARSGKPA